MPTHKRRSKQQRVLAALALIVLPPFAAVVLATLSVGLTKHDFQGRQPPPVYDVLFPISLVATFVCVPIGAYLLFRALTAGGGEEE